MHFLQLLRAVYFLALHSRIEICTSWPPILRLTLGALSACPPRLLPSGIASSYGNLYSLATHTEAHSRCTFCVSSLPFGTAFSYRNLYLMATHAEAHSKLMFCAPACNRTRSRLEHPSFATHIEVRYKTILQKISFLDVFWGPVGPGTSQIDGG